MSGVSTSPLATPALTPTGSTSGTPRRTYSKNGLTNSALASPTTGTATDGTVAPINSSANQATTTSGSGTTTSTAGASSQNEGLKLRLDLNLEVDVRITAKVHGDVTLSLLYVNVYLFSTHTLMRPLVTKRLFDAGELPSRMSKNLTWNDETHERDGPIIVHPNYIIRDAGVCPVTYPLNLYNTGTINLRIFNFRST
jgi:hypothetical protein